jgi:MSHA biogenesis protein MshP
MTRHAYHPQQSRRSAGVGLVTAIFLLVVLAGLGVAMVTLFTTQQASSTLDEQGARAYQAARAGIEWGLFQHLRNDSCTPVTSFVPQAATLSGFTVTVTCTPSGTSPLVRYVIRSAACNQPANGACTETSATNNPDYVARKIEVEI